jgi:hypothetical protein
MLLYICRVKIDGMTSPKIILDKEVVILPFDFMECFDAKNQTR